MTFVKPVRCNKPNIAYTHSDLESTAFQFIRNRLLEQLLLNNLKTPITVFAVVLTWRLVCNVTSLQWRHNELDGISNHLPLNCVLNRLFRRRSKKTSKFRVTGLCEWNPPVTVGFPSQRASNAEKVSFSMASSCIAHSHVFCLFFRFVIICCCWYTCCICP